jgi:hypothetical protein
MTLGSFCQSRYYRSSFFAAHRAFAANFLASFCQTTLMKRIDILRPEYNLRLQPNPDDRCTSISIFAPVGSIGPYFIRTGPMVSLPNRLSDLRAARLHSHKPLRGSSTDRPPALHDHCDPADNHERNHDRSRSSRRSSSPWYVASLKGCHERTIIDRRKKPHGIGMVGI